MTRDDVIEAMAKTIWIFDGNPACDWGEFEDDRGHFKDAASAALSSLESLGIALVPVKPTDEMQDAGMNSLVVVTNSGLLRIWNYMIAASPLRKTEGGDE